MGERSVRSARRGSGAAATPVTAAFESSLVAFVRAVRGQPWSEVVETDDVIVGVTGVPLPAMNIVARAVLAPPTADARIGEVLARLAGCHVPFSWWVTPTSAPGDLVGRLTRAGLADAAALPAMALDLAAWTRRGTPPGVGVERVREGGAWTDTVRAMALGFDLPDAVVPTLAERFGALLSRRDLRWFAARFDGEIVACALSVVSGGVVGIYNVATIPEARGRGAGSAVTAAALADGRRSGATVAVLESSEMGHAVYRRLGFEDVGTVRILVGGAG
ncbi:MAG TPA: GNAT family N-acetyltransferase [Candidatus Dormibacteraeota bacterium]|nr:GNAT family N-acetyltransferase [Candidatus Dormibacteraeota bacterium]